MSKGLDGRHRDANGQISEKHGNTLVRTIRAEYGQEPDQARSSKNAQVSNKARCASKPNFMTAIAWRIFANGRARHTKVED
jgi:hypothetical protein